MRIFLVRHGESEGNKNSRVYFEKNDCDICLTEKGKADAVGAGDRILDLLDHFNNRFQNTLIKRTPPFVFACYHSTYKRAEQTANIVIDRINSFEGYKIETIKSSPLLREREWGSLRDIIKSRQKTDDHFNFYYRPTGGESFSDAYQRAAIFHQYLLQDSRYYNNIIVAHGELIKVYLMHLMSWSVDEFKKWDNLKNGEVLVFDTDTKQLSSFTPLRHSKYYKNEETV